MLYNNNEVFGNLLRMGKERGVDPLQNEFRLLRTLCENTEGIIDKAGVDRLYFQDIMSAYKSVGHDKQRFRPYRGKFLGV